MASDASESDEEDPKGVEEESDLDDLESEKSDGPPAIDEGGRRTQRV